MMKKSAYFGGTCYMKNWKIISIKLMDIIILVFWYLRIEGQS